MNLKQSQDQRERVLEACLTLVLQHGPRGFNVQMLTEEAGIGTSTFFRLFHGIDSLIEDFWLWCWKELNGYLAQCLFGDEPIGDVNRSAKSTLLREFDYIWELPRDEKLFDIAFLCFLYYRRSNDLGAGKQIGEDQQRFETRILRLCEGIIAETEAKASSETLQVMVMNWCATVLMAWHYAPDASREVSAAHARLGLKDTIQTTVSDEVAA